MSRGGTPRKKPAQGTPPFWSEEQGNQPIWETVTEIGNSLIEKHARIKGKSVVNGDNGSKVVSFLLEIPTGLPELNVNMEFGVRVVISAEAKTLEVVLTDHGTETEFDQADIIEGEKLRPIIEAAMSIYFQSLGGAAA